jgi:hypothetical protein
MGALSESVGSAPRVRKVISIAIDPVSLTASAILREGVIVDGKLIPTTGDRCISVPVDVAAAQLTAPISDVADEAGISETALLSMSFCDLIVALFDPYA